MKLFRLSVTGLFLMASLLLTGCNTAKGFGQDLEKVGGKIEESAKEKGADE